MTEESKGPGQWQSRQHRMAAEVADYLERIDYPRHGNQVRITGIKIRPPGESSLEALVVITGVHEDGDPVVAFMSGDSSLSALWKAVKGWHHESLNWKVDEYRS